MLKDAFPARKLPEASKNTVAPYKFVKFISISSISKLSVVYAVQACKSISMPYRLVKEYIYSVMVWSDYIYVIDL